MLKSLIGVLVGSLIFVVGFYFGHIHGETVAPTGMMAMMSQGH